jgi:hypothetical protein
MDILEDIGAQLRSPAFVFIGNLGHAALGNFRCQQRIAGVLTQMRKPELATKWAMVHAQKPVAVGERGSALALYSETVEALDLRKLIGKTMPPIVVAYDAIRDRAAQERVAFTDAIVTGLLVSDPNYKLPEESTNPQVQAELKRLHFNDWLNRPRAKISAAAVSLSDEAPFNLSERYILPIVLRAREYEMGLGDPSRVRLDDLGISNELVPHLFRRMEVLFGDKPGLGAFQAALVREYKNHSLFQFSSDGAASQDLQAILDAARQRFIRGGPLDMMREFSGTNLTTSVVICARLKAAFGIDRVVQLAQSPDKVCAPRATDINAAITSALRFEKDQKPLDRFSFILYGDETAPSLRVLAGLAARSGVEISPQAIDKAFGNHIAHVYEEQLLPRARDAFASKKLHAGDGLLRAAAQLLNHGRLPTRRALAGMKLVALAKNQA